MKFYLPARSENLDFFGIVDINEQYKKWLLKMHKKLLMLHAEEDSLAHFCFWDCTIDWYDRDLTGVADEDEVGLSVAMDGEDDCEVHRLPDDFKMSESTNQASTELEMLVITERGFYWKCFPKHCNERVVADLIEWKELQDGRGRDQETGAVRDAPES